MNFKKVALAMMIASSMTAVAHADGGHGKITFKGSVIDAACSIDAGSLDQTVELGAITSRILNTSGQSTPVPFEIKLHDCSVEVSKGVKVSFNGTAGDAAKSLDKSFATSGSAKGIGVTVSALGGTVIPPNTSSDSIVLNDGDNDLQFQAYVQGSATSGDVTPGAFTATTNFVLQYD